MMEVVMAPCKGFMPSVEGDMRNVKPMYLFCSLRMTSFGESLKNRILAAYGLVEIPRMMNKPPFRGEKI